MPFVYSTVQPNHAILNIGTKSRARKTNGRPHLPQDVFLHRQQLIERRWYRSIHLPWFLPIIFLKWDHIVHQMRSSGATSLNVRPRWGPNGWIWGTTGDGWGLLSTSPTLRATPNATNNLPTYVHTWSSLSLENGWRALAGTRYSVCQTTSIGLISKLHR